MYSSKFILFLKANSLITLAENIADNGGFKEALYAYRKHVAKSGPEPLLPQFENFTHDQLYTLGFANVIARHTQLFYKFFGIYQSNFSIFISFLFNS